MPGTARSRKPRGRRSRGRGRAGVGHTHRAHTSGGPALHRAQAHASAKPVGVAVITVSSTRDERTDESGAYLRRAFERRGHKVLFYAVVKDDVSQIQAALKDALSTPGADLVVTNGGTGMGRADVTIEAVLPLLEKRADGWGDVFRSVSLRQIGTAAFLTRTAAGTVGGKWVVAVPGSLGAVKTAAEELLLPDLEHMLFEARR